MNFPGIPRIFSDTEKDVDNRLAWDNDILVRIPLSCISLSLFLSLVCLSVFVRVGRVCRWGLPKGPFSGKSSQIGFSFCLPFGDRGIVLSTGISFLRGKHWTGP